MWIEIFNSGTHQDSSGNEQLYTPEALDKMVAVYNERTMNDPTLEAPIVKGHPQSDDPAYGWVEKLVRRGNVLLAKLKDLSDDFVGEVRKGLYKKVSIAIYPDYMLRHIGFLGAAQPAVKGLAPLNFSESDNYNEFEEQPAQDQANSNQAETDTIQELTDLLQESESEINSLLEKINNLEEEISTLKQENERLTGYISDLERAGRRKEYREFVDSLIRNPEGMLIPPALTETAVNILDFAFVAEKEKPLCFNSPEHNSAVEMIKTFLTGFKPLVQSGEFAVRRNTGNLTAELDFSGSNVSVDRLVLHQKAKEIQAESPELTYEEAVNKAAKAINN
jgi:predicted ribosome quality control (RQC) complex YloA/Tae2 family protein